MKKSTKKSKSNPTPGLCELSKDTKLPIYLEEYKNFETKEIQPVTHSFLEKLGKELVAFAETSDVLRVEWFFLKKRIPHSTAATWASKYSDFGESYREARYIIGLRREHGAMIKELDASMVKFTLPVYDPEWKTASEWAAKLRNENPDNQGIIKVVLEKIESSDLVPIKKE